MPVKDKTFEQWYATVPKEKADTTTYNLRRAYELAPEEQLVAFANDPDAHLYSSYENPDTGEYEFMKSKDHSTIGKELDWYNGNTADARKFRRKYALDTSGEYYRYVPREKRSKQILQGIFNGSIFSK